MKSRFVLPFLLALAGCATPPTDKNLDEESDAAILAYAGDFQRCHVDYGGGAPVDVTLKYQLNYSGGVLFVDIDRDRPYESNEAFDKCVRKVFLRITFPQSATGLGYGVWSRKQITIGH